MILTPKESGEFIVQNAILLHVNDDGINKIVEMVTEGIESGTISIDNFLQQKYHPTANDAHAIDWIFFVDTLNFCFWSLSPPNLKWSIDGETGYFALCAAVNRAIKNGIDILNPEFYSKVTQVELEEILMGDPEGGVPLPQLLEERVACLHEVGSLLLLKYNGKFENMVKAAGQSAQELIHIVTDSFPCYRDETILNGELVSFYKRAQILIGDLWSCFRGEDIGKFNDIESITMFADYRVPQTLVHFGALVYNDNLLKTLKANTIMKTGYREEVEIRGASIYIVETVRERVFKILNSEKPRYNKNQINSILIDHFLWDYRRKHAAELESIPFHKCVGIFY